MTSLDNEQRVSGEPATGATPARRRGTNKRRNLGALLVLVPLGFVAAFFAYPVLEMFRLSFTEIFQGNTGVLGNYAWYLANDTQMTILRRTFLVSIWVTVICVGLGFPYAYLMTLVRPRTRLLMMAAVLLPFWSNLVVRTYAWVILLQDTGPVRDMLRVFGIDDVRLIGNMTGVTIGATQLLLPFLVLPLYATLSRIDRRLLDAAESLGAKPRVAFTRIYLPLAVPGLLAGALIVFILMLGFYFTPALLGSTNNSLVSQQIVTQVNQLLAFGRGGAMALVLLVVTLVLVGIASLATRPLSKALRSGDDQ